MQSLKQKLSENVLDKISMDFLRNQVLKNAYGNDDTVIVTLDPRVLSAWFPGSSTTSPSCWGASCW